MKSLSINEGLESFMINDDPGRVIRFNPADPEIINRLFHLQERFAAYKTKEEVELNPDGSPKDDLERGASYISEFTAAMREAFNEVFNSDLYDTIFNGQSPLCIVGSKGKEKYLFEEVTDVLIGAMQPAIKEYSRKNEQKLGRYLRDIQQ